MACDKITKNICGKKKGQIAIEFIFLMLIVFTLIATIVAPASNVAVNSVKEVGGTAQCKLNASMLANAIDTVNIAGNGAKQTLLLQIPPNCLIKKDTDNSKKITFKYTQGKSTNSGTINLKTPISNSSTCPNTNMELTIMPLSVIATITSNNGKGTFNCKTS